MLTDSHCHIERYGPDLPAVLSRAEAAGVSTLLAIGIGEGPDTMHEALHLARAHSTSGMRILASAGIHPQEAHQATPEELRRLQALLEDPLTVAVGEIGLDYYHVENPVPATQQAAFVAQMQLAAEARKPILIHLRSSELATPGAREKFNYTPNPPGAVAWQNDPAWRDFFSLLGEHWTPTGLAGVMHCFSGGPAEAEHALALGFYISFAGNLTYPKADSLREAARMVPLDRLLIETDAPFLAPMPHRGQQNEPALVRLTAEFLAELRGMPLAALAEQTTDNFHRLIGATDATNHPESHLSSKET